MFDAVEAFYRPGSVGEALRLLHGAKGQARVVAGCTDVVVEGGRSVRFLIDLSRAGLSYIRVRDGGLALGATTTMAALEESVIIQRLANGVLAGAAACCGSAQIRNMATLGGNLANGSPAADLAGPLLALDARATIADGKSRRRIALAEYLAKPARGEALLVEVVIPNPPRGRNWGWSLQRAARTAVDISLVSVTAGVQLDARGRVKQTRIALGAAAPTPFRVAEAEGLMTGRVLDRLLIAEVSEAVAEAAQPISDVRASAEYRRELCRVLAGRALEECAERAEWPL